jgi:hypothetical protein
MTGDIVVTWNTDRWYISQDAPENFVIADYDRKDDAVLAARAVALYAGVELVVKNQDGTIAWRNSYGNDRKDRPG